ncbi:MAG: signal peptide peptidase SppA [Deltaproteobacteria bacterium]|nr:signal peptide peptidase SppA [Deltaproteobacteria bacterium]
MMRAVLAIAIAISSLFLATGCITPIIDLGSLGRVSPLTEVTITGDADAKLAMLEVTGVISFVEEGWSFTGQKPSVIARLHEALELAAGDPKVKGLILRVRSPGGGVAASETLHHLISDWKQHTGKPVVAFLQGIAASGGYYVAMAADTVVAHPSSITGSIGVIMPGINLAGLMERFGVADQTLISGAFKDSGSTLRAMREDERLQLQSVIDDLYGRFVDVVDAGRPGLDRTSVERLSDGRIFSASQALEEGLVDQIGHLDVAITRARDLAGLSKFKLVAYKEAGRPANNIYSDISSRAPAPVSRELNLISVGVSKIPAGFYYLWPMALPR